ncbi:crossover junction endonuclease EME1B-like isoform X1 [Cucurbita moschata]|uniref:Crossover junction endonuclease EME1B-like isoform X1 n=1 Tax=Cucurbita moschata TaxID=3662 RepID=A0A6J1GF29_CUCMO|nr:crossover junction endonuclease EME1B-like isoform X1 [Cucurbita moschata]
MSRLIVLSDEEDRYSTPLPIPSKKRRTESHAFPSIKSTVLVLDDDPTPQKSGSNSAASFVPETPLSPPPSSDVVIVKCTKVPLDLPARDLNSDHKFAGISGLICLESGSESESDSLKKRCGPSEWIGSDCDDMKNLGSTSKFDSAGSGPSIGNDDLQEISGDTKPSTVGRDDYIYQVLDFPEKENVGMEQNDNTIKATGRKSDAEKNKNVDKATRKKATKDDKIRLMEEKKKKKELEKLQKAAQKAEAAEMRKMQKEKQKWEKGKLALKSIVAEIDAKVVELGSVGGHLLTRFAEKGITFRIKSNPIERSIVWTMNAPEHISESFKGLEIAYVLLMYEAENFCELLSKESLVHHVARVQSHYPSYTICYLTNRLMAFINKREQEKYKNSASSNGWIRPPVEEELAKLTTHFVKVRSRQCVDEAEVADHIVGLTCSLASCQFRKKLTHLSVNANGSIIPKDCIDRNMIKKSLWLKALVAIPKVQPRFAVAIWKKYPTMKSLLSVYMDPCKSVHEKEFLLKDLTIEGLLGDDRRLGEMCSKRVYRILMAQSGSMRTDDVEEGADMFRSQLP